MSDDEQDPPLEPMDDEQDPPIGGDDSDGDMMDGDDGVPGEPLPEGVQKEILTEAPREENWKTPKRGDEVTVHYVGTLESDGSEFDSSRSRETPFKFTLGKGQVIKGWDLGVATMKKGEIAKFVLAPEFAYGDAGSPPKIPEKATLVFEVELISWVSKDDLFCDEGVIKTLVKEGSGWKMPKKNNEVVISLKATAADGTVIEERTDFEYIVGSEALGCLTKAVGKALEGMKKGEEAELKCSKWYSYEDRDQGATIALKLQEVYETKDVSFSKDTSVMKKQVKEGEGWNTPKDTTKVKISVEAATCGGVALPGFAAQVLEFTVGNGEVCDALECAALEMKKGERAVLSVRSFADVAEEKLGLKEAATPAEGAPAAVLVVELQDFDKTKDTWDMAEDEKVAFGLARKEVGSSLFKAGRLHLALQRYTKSADLLNHIDNFKEDNKSKAKEVKTACELNKAAVCLKLKDYAQAKAACGTILKDDARNVKALYRQAKAELGLKNFMDCIHGVKKVLAADSQNKEARDLLKEARAGQREEDKTSQVFYSNMCKALGKLPTPPPSKPTKRPRSEDGSDGEAEDDEAAAPAEEGGVVTKGECAADAGAAVAAAAADAEMPEVGEAKGAAAA